MSTSPQQRQYLEAMGIQVWVSRDQQEAEPEQAFATEPVSTPPASAETVPVGDIAAMDWAALKAKVAGCTACELHQKRTQSVFGVGDEQADWMIIGEAPGADEDRQGEPFVGKAGQLLNAMLLAIGFKREQVYIANIVKCRPPGNRDPQSEEAGCCRAYLERQIELIQPKLILAVGRVAAHNLLDTDEKVGRMRGQVYNFGNTGIPLVVTYHPAYLLRSPSEKRKVWGDLQMARQVYQQNQ